MMIFKLNLEDVRNRGGFVCVQIQVVIGLPFWVQVPQPPSFPGAPLPWSPTVAGRVGVLLNGGSSKWGEFYQPCLLGFAAESEMGWYLLPARPPLPTPPRGRPPAPRPDPGLSLLSPRPHPPTPSRAATGLVFQPPCGRASWQPCRDLFRVHSNHQLNGAGRSAPDLPAPSLRQPVLAFPLPGLRGVTTVCPQGGGSRGQDSHLPASSLGQRPPESAE